MFSSVTQFEIYMKKFFSKSLLWALVGSLPGPLFAQAADEISEPSLMLYVPTPQTWSFMRYGNTQVDYYTGTAKVDVPLYEYSDPDFRFSISAGYASGGFIPQKQTGILGLNWFLSCGGAVTRDIRGLDDFASGLNSEDRNAGFLARPVSYSDRELENFEIGAYRYQDTYSVGNSEVHADIFHFNFMGYSGVFHYDGERHLKVYDTQGGHGTYAVEIDNQGSGSGSSVTIRTADGYTYVFGGTERALERMVKGSLTEYGQYELADQRQTVFPIVTWLLTSVTAPNGRKLLFSYDSFPGSYPSYINMDTDNPYFVTSFSLGRNSFMPDPEQPGGATAHYRQVSVIKTAYLERVTVTDSLDIGLTYSRKGCFDVAKKKTYPFAAMADGNIVQNLKKLDAIHVRYGQRLIRSCDFSYHVDSQRLILDSINVSGIGTYKMNYCQAKADLYKQVFPDITTSSVDFWGYYNGRDNHYTAITPAIIENSSLNCNETVVDSFKNPDANFSRMGCLKRIEYPTRGFTEFDYEPNDAAYILLKRDKPYGDPEFVRPDQEASSSPGYLASLYPFHTPFKPDTSTDEAGGVRVCRISDYDGLGGWQTRKFEYMEGRKSSGIVTYFPHFYNFKTGGAIVEIPLLNSVLNSFDKQQIGYGTVKEIHSDGSYIVYEFNNYRTHPDNYDGQQCKRIAHASYLVDPEYTDNILREPNSCHFQRGKLHAETLYDAHGRRVRCEEMEYKSHDNSYSVYVVASGNYIYSVRKPTGDYRLDSKTTTDYFGADSLQIRESYQYNDFGQLRCVTRWLPDETMDWAETTYLHETPHEFDPQKVPLEYPAEIVGIHMPSSLAQYKTITSATRYTYRDLGNLIKPETVATVNMEHPVVVVRSPVPTKEVTLEYTDKLCYESYDEQGNPVQIRDAEGYRTCFIWGYGGLYPVAKVYNVSYETLKTVLNIGVRPLAEGLSAEQIRRLYALENVLVDVYEYIPYAGPVRHIDPSGREYGFRYDSHGRLIETGDSQGVLAKYEYHL